LLLCRLRCEPSHARWEVGPGALKQLSGLQNESDVRAVLELLGRQLAALNRAKRPVGQAIS
jgi:hypothetical protein